jgi:MazG family protein
VASSKRTAGAEFDRLVSILATLRGERGCPWDRAQDARSITNHFLEEVYEAADAVLAGDAAGVAEELGDVLMEIVFLSRIFEEQGAFSAADALRSINEKMIRRHPHVFGAAKSRRAREVITAWQKGKLAEKSRRSVLDGLPASAPALLAAFQVAARASTVGFDWGAGGPALAKVKEEVLELEKALAGRSRKGIEEELGDLFFALANVSRLVGANPELVLRRANRKFARRFRAVEGRLRRAGKEPLQTSLDEMNGLWDDVKRTEKHRAGKRAPQHRTSRIKGSSGGIHRRNSEKTGEEP